MDGERLAVTEERRLAVASWIQANVRPVQHVLEEEEQFDQDELSPAFEVREYQLDAWANLWDARQRGESRALVHLATGLGKTSVAALDVMKFREECHAIDPELNPRILFVSHRTEISEQAQERFSQFMPDLETEFFRTKRKQLPEADLTFATFQSLRSELDRFDPQYFDYIIWDEAHHSEAETFKRVREHFDPLFEVALSATPDRMDQLDIREYFGQPLYSKSLPEGIAEGWLADVDYHIVFDDIVKQLMEEGFQPSTLQEFHELFRVRPRNEVIAHNIREERHKIGLDNAKTMVFCEDIAHTEEMAELLGGVAYHSGIKKDERRQLLQDFRTNGNQVICTVDMFNEGIDIPDARLVVFLRSTQSGTVFEQELGRGLRRAPGKDRVTVLDFVANIERIAKVRELSQRIERRARELGQRDITEEGTIVGGPGTPGLRVHTEHGNFDFDRVAVDLLERWEQLSISDNAMEPPEGFTSVSKFSEQEGYTRDMVLKAAAVLKLELSTFRFGPTPGIALGPDQQQLILDYLETTVPVAPEDYRTVNGFAQELGVSYMTIKKIVEAEEFKLKKYTFLGEKIGTIALGLTPEHQGTIRRHPAIAAPEAPKGYLSIPAFARQLGISPATLEKLASGLDMELVKYRAPEGGKGNRARMLSLSQQNHLRRQPVVSQRPPEGYVSVGRFAKTNGVHARTIRRAIDELGLVLPEYLFSTHIVPGLSPNDQAKILSYLGNMRS